MNTPSLEQIGSEEWLNSLEYCICGTRVTETPTHSTCVISGIARGIFNDLTTWKEYCKINGKRVAEHYRSSSRTMILIPEPATDNLKNR
jgi:hypothetical protein